MQSLKDLMPFVCIHYPGRVVNDEKMVATLGGMDNISEIICDERRKPQLWFRPEDKLSTSVNGTRKPSTSLVMKVRVKKNSQHIVSHKIIGYITEEFSFRTLCDFQYIAMHNGINVYNKVVPTDINADWLRGDGPALLVPPLMSRIDTVQSYHYSKDKVSDQEEGSKVISTSRRKRFGLARFIYFEDPEVPLIPKEVPPNLVKPLKANRSLEIVKKAFEDRPIYSKTALAAVTGISLSSLKDIVPFAAYHFTNGPWRAMWVRLGYDPRKDPGAKIYQTLDFRVRTSLDEGNVQMKRTARNSAIPRLSKKPCERDDTVPPEGHIFVPGKLPPYRVVFYQYCDVHVAEVQALLESVEVQPVCDIIDGWLPEGTSFACRRIMNLYVTESAKLQPSEPGSDPAETSQAITYDSSTSTQSDVE